MLKIVTTFLLIAFTSGCSTLASPDRVPDWLKVPGYNSPDLPPEACVSPMAYDTETGKSSPKYTGRCISMDIRDQSIQTVVRWLGEVANLNHIFDNDIQCSVNAHFVDLPWDAILDYSLRSCGLRQYRKATTIRILTSENYSEQYVPVCGHPIMDPEELEPLTTAVVHLRHANAEEMLPLTNDLLTKRGKSYLEKQTNSIIVRDIKRGQKEVKEVLRTLDIPRDNITDGQITTGSSGESTAKE